MNLTRTSLRVVLLLICGGATCPARSVDIHTPRMRVLDIAAQVQRYHDFMAYERQRRDDTLEHRPSTATTAVQSDERIPIAFGRRSDSRVETATSADGRWPYDGMLCSGADSAAERSVPSRRGIDKGVLLVATPKQTGYFNSTVVLLCENSARGAYGLILNRPLDAERREHLHPALLLSSHTSLREGGAAATPEISLVHEAETDGADASGQEGRRLLDGIILSSAAAIPSLVHRTADPADDDSKVLVFFGYAGWRPHALEVQHDQGLWLSCAASAGYIMHMPVESLHNWLTLNCMPPTGTAGADHLGATH